MPTVSRAGKNNFFLGAQPGDKNFLQTNQGMSVNHMLSHPVSKAGKNHFRPGSTTWRQKFPADPPRNNVCQPYVITMHRYT
jgi:hypothetical protein